MHFSIYLHMLPHLSSHVDVLECHAVTIVGTTIPVPYDPYQVNWTHYIRYQKMKTIVIWSSNEQWHDLMIGYQFNGSHNCGHGGMPYYDGSWINCLIQTLYSMIPINSLVVRFNAGVVTSYTVHWCPYNQLLLISLWGHLNIETLDQIHNS